MGTTRIGTIIKNYKNGEIDTAVNEILEINLWMHRANYNKLLKIQNIISANKDKRGKALLPLVEAFIKEYEQMDSKNKAFIVHGWDNELKLEAKNFFQDTLGIKCVILHEQNGEGDVIFTLRRRKHCGKDPYKW